MIDLYIPKSAVKAHMNHGDSMGKCDEDDDEEDDEDEEDEEEDEDEKSVIPQTMFLKHLKCLLHVNIAALLLLGFPH